MSLLIPSHQHCMLKLSLVHQLIQLLDKAVQEPETAIAPQTRGNVCNRLTRASIASFTKDTSTKDTSGVSSTKGSCFFMASSPFWLSWFPLASGSVAISSGIECTRQEPCRRCSSLHIPLIPMPSHCSYSMHGDDLLPTSQSREIAL